MPHVNFRSVQMAYLYGSSYSPYYTVRGVPFISATAMIIKGRALAASIINLK